MDVFQRLYAILHGCSDCEDKLIQIEGLFLEMDDRAFGDGYALGAREALLLFASKKPINQFVH